MVLGLGPGSVRLAESLQEFCSMPGQSLALKGHRCTQAWAQAEETRCGRKPKSSARVQGGRKPFSAKALHSAHMNFKAWWLSAFCAFIAFLEPQESLNRRSWYSGPPAARTKSPCAHALLSGTTKRRAGNLGIEGSGQLFRSTA